MSRQIIPRERPGAEVHYDDSQKPPGEIVAAILRYDAHLRPRWNREIQRWEIWRWRDAPSSASQHISESDRGEKILFCFVVKEPGTGAYRQLDHRIIGDLQRADLWRKYGVTKTKEDADRMGAKMDREDAQEEAKFEKQIDDFNDDFVVDHRRQIAEFFGHSMPIVPMYNRDEVKNAK